MGYGTENLKTMSPLDKQFHSNTDNVPFLEKPETSLWESHRGCFVEVIPIENIIASLFTQRVLLDGKSFYRGLGL